MSWLGEQPKNIRSKVETARLKDYFHAHFYQIGGYQDGIVDCCAVLVRVLESFVTKYLPEFLERKSPLITFCPDYQVKGDLINVNDILVVEKGDHHETLSGLAFPSLLCQ